jgi:hypothetical protein
MLYFWWRQSIKEKKRVMKWKGQIHPRQTPYTAIKLMLVTPFVPSATKPEKVTSAWVRLLEGIVDEQNPS